MLRRKAVLFNTIVRYLLITIYKDWICEGNVSEGSIKTALLVRQKTLTGMYHVVGSY